ncbi:hypothetical protein [Roseinatronobacter sp.]|nr:hypothetical protein [Rhodobaca sp.]
MIQIETGEVMIEEILGLFVCGKDGDEGGGRLLRSVTLRAYM